MQNESISQLADIIADWCELDLAGDRFAGAGPDKVAQEMVRCMLFTLASDRTALDLFNRLLRNEIIDRNQARVALDSGI